MKKVFLSVVMALVALTMLASAVFASPGGPYGAEVQQQLAEVRQATVKYQDVQVALADGFINTGMCVASPAGGMGVHFVNLARIMDPALNAVEPEVLLYQPTPNGGYRLVGVEYMLAIGAPDAPVPANPPPAPQLFGVSFDGPMVGHGPGEPPHYDLHVWLWQANPNGMFSQFNPNVKCQS